MTVVRFLVWHTVLLALLLSFLGHPTQAIYFWIAYWLIPTMVLLPVLRFIGEVEEHDYDTGAPSILLFTYNNVGTLHWLVHPHNDGYHALHHLFPAIPHYRLKSMYYLLGRIDLSGWRERVRERRGLLRPPPSDGSRQC